MAVAGESLPDPWGVRATSPRWQWAAGAIALALHVGLAASMMAINPARFHAEMPIEISVEEKVPPPEIKPAPKEPPPPPPPERPRVVMKRAPAPAIQPATPAPPPPNEEPPKPATEAPPVFGVTMSSVVSGPGPGMAVPIGNTLMTKPGKTAKPGEVKPYAGEGTRPFTPVADIYISKYPTIIHEVNGEDVYPPDARRMEIEGKVVLKIGIDENGTVVQVKVVERAGHGFDEAAAKAMRQSKFTPAIANDGRPVPYQLTWTFSFTLTH